MKKGISLIVLVITIIVMIILAASVVITLSNTGVIDRAGKAVDLTNEAAVQDLAALTWADAYMDNLRGQELIDKVTEELEEQGVTANDWNVTVTDTGVTVLSKNSGTTEEDEGGFNVTYYHENGGYFTYEPSYPTITVKYTNGTTETYTFTSMQNGVFPSDWKEQTGFEPGAHMIGNGYTFKNVAEVSITAMLGGESGTVYLMVNGNNIGATYNAVLTEDITFYTAGGNF